MRREVKKVEKCGIVKYSVRAELITDCNNIEVICNIEDYSAVATVYMYNRQGKWTGIAIGNHRVETIKGFPTIDDMKQIAFEMASAEWEAKNN